MNRASARHRLDPDLINAVIWVESRFQPRARSSAGARGLMQLMPATASAMAAALDHPRANSYDPEFNVSAGSYYLAKLIDRYDRDVRLALAAYNAGAGNVDRWMVQGGLPPTSERYVEMVLNARARFAAARQDSSPATVRLAQAPPQREPAVAPREPVVPEPPQRPNPDRVESTYVPHPDPEPPLRDTPYPPLEPERRPSKQLSMEREPDSAPKVGPGILPSILDR